MRTVRVDVDHVAKYRKVSRGTYEYTLIHALTARELRTSHCEVSEEARHRGPKVVAQVIASNADDDLQLIQVERARASERFARGQAVPDAPALPTPKQQELARDGSIEVSAALPVMLIRNAFNRQLLTVERDANERNAIAIGRQVLIGATDAQILAIARGKATLEGSLRTGVRYVEVG